MAKAFDPSNHIPCSLCGEGGPLSLLVSLSLNGLLPNYYSFLASHLLCIQTKQHPSSNTRPLKICESPRPRLAVNRCLRVPLHPLQALSFGGTEAAGEFFKKVGLNFEFGLNV